MKVIQISIGLSDALQIESISIQFNNTGLKSDSALVKKVAAAMFKTIDLNSDVFLTQDLLNDMGIKVKKE